MTKVMGFFLECDIAITVSKYRDKIPGYIYEKLLTIRVRIDVYIAENTGIIIE